MRKLLKRPWVWVLAALAGAVIVGSWLWLWWADRSALPSADEVASMTCLLEGKDLDGKELPPHLDPATGRFHHGRITFTIPREHVAPVLRSLRPAKLDQPPYWSGYWYGTLTLHCETAKRFASFSSRRRPLPNRGR